MMPPDWPTWLTIMLDGLRIARFFSLVKDALSRLYEAIRGRRALVPAGELMRYDDLYVSVMRDMLGEAHRSVGNAMRELRLSGLKNGVAKLSRLNRQLEALRGSLRPWSPVSWREKERYNKKILDYVNLAAVCECHSVYEGAEELLFSPDDMTILIDVSDNMINTMRKVKVLRNTLSWALRLPSPRDFLEALRSEALKRARGGERDRINIYDSVVKVAEAFILADSKRERDAHKIIAYDVLSAIRALSPVGKPIVRLDELWDKVRAVRPGIGLRELKKSIRYLWEEGLIPEVIEAGRRGPIAVLRPKGLEPEINEIITLVGRDGQLRRNGFTVLELASKMGWSEGVVERAIAEMEKYGRVWRRKMREGFIKWFIQELYEEGRGHEKGSAVEAQGG